MALLRRTTLKMKLIILDRDGVINYDSKNYIKNLDEWQPIPGSIEAIAKLKKKNYTIAVVTNQSGVARKYYDINTLNLMHNKFRRLLANQGVKVDAIFFCPHGPDDNCNCRKPKTGLYQHVASLFNTTLKDSITVGDSFRDLQAAMAMQSRPVLVKTGKGQSTLEKHQVEILQNHIPVYENLMDFVNSFLE